MNHTFKILIPAGLGVLAGFLNLMVMWSQTTPVTFIKVSGNIEAGSNFSPQNLAPVKIPNSYAHLSETAIPYNDLGVLLDHPAPRSFKDGDIVFWRDSPEAEVQVELLPGEDLIPVSMSGVDFIPRLLRIGESISLRVKMEGAPEPFWLGPFRVVTINNRITNEEGAAGSVMAINMVGLAVKRPADATTPSLAEQFFDARSSENRIIRIKHHMPARTSP